MIIILNYYINDYHNFQSFFTIPTVRYRISHSCSNWIQTDSSALILILFYEIFLLYKRDWMKGIFCTCMIHVIFIRLCDRAVGFAHPYNYPCYVCGDQKFQLLSNWVFVERRLWTSFFLIIACSAAVCVFLLFPWSNTYIAVCPISQLPMEIAPTHHLRNRLYYCYHLVRSIVDYNHFILLGLAFLYSISCEIGRFKIKPVYTTCSFLLNVVHMHMYVIY